MEKHFNLNKRLKIRDVCKKSNIDQIWSQKLHFSSVHGYDWDKTWYRHNTLIKKQDCETDFELPPRRSMNCFVTESCGCGELKSCFGLENGSCLHNLDKIQDDSHGSKLKNLPNLTTQITFWVYKRIPFMWFRQS